MNWLVFHLVSGQAFFTGVLCCMSGMLMGMSDRRNVFKYSLIVWYMGIILIASSSTPIPLAGVYLLIVSNWLWYVFRNNKSYEGYAVGLVNCMYLGLFLFELPYHMMPRLNYQNYQTMAVLGDSLSSNDNEEAIAWPGLIMLNEGINVRNLSFPGDTLKTANHRWVVELPHNQVVLVELGGNDILGGTSTKNFEQELDRLLRRLVQDNYVIMFELPLPPFCQEYGRIQRQVAARHCVTLIPKRFLLSVIAEDSSTVDSLHLNQRGHAKFAAELWLIIEPLFNK
jgi:acyl-CoA thioesterase-1